jgi:hypothetical protein
VILKVNEETGRPELNAELRDERDRYIAGLRGLLDFYERNEDMPAPICTTECVHVPDSSKEMAALTRAAGGLRKESYVDNAFIMKREFGPVVFRLLCFKEQTCERVKVGEIVIPAKPERILPAEPEQVVEQFEWKCPESILAHSKLETAGATNVT